MEQPCTPAPRRNADPKLADIPASQRRSGFQMFMLSFLMMAIHVSEALHDPNNLVSTLSLE